MPWNDSELAKRINNPTVLIADESTNADIYAAWLDDSYHVMTITDGEVVLDTIDETIDVLILSRNMTNVSVDNTLAAIREHEFDCQVVLVSEDEPNVDVAELDFDDLLVKPILKDQLLTTVECMIQRNGYSEQLRKVSRLISRLSVLKKYISSHQLTDSDQYEALRDSLGIYHLNTDFDPNDLTDRDRARFNRLVNSKYESESQDSRDSPPLKVEHSS
ncbi:MAG: response regulator [Halobacteriaceae archaeon]